MTGLSSEVCLPALRKVPLLRRRPFQDKIHEKKTCKRKSLFFQKATKRSRIGARTTKSTPVTAKSYLPPCRQWIVSDLAFHIVFVTTQSSVIGMAFNVSSIFIACTGIYSPFIRIPPPVSDSNSLEVFKSNCRFSFESS